MAGFFKSGVYVGNGGASQAIVTGFQPDYVWIRPDTGIGPVRGFVPGITTSYCVMGDQNGSWVANDGSNGLASVGATGFTVQSGLNTNLINYIYTAWIGSPNICQRINWTGDGTGGRLIAHTLGAQPQMVFNERAFSGSGGAGDTLTSQPFIQGTLGSVNIQDFNPTANNKFSTALNAGLYNNVRVSATNLSVAAFLNANTALYYAYLWANAVGYCKVGLYTGNGAANGTAIDLGFVPTAIMLNRCDAVANGELPSVWVKDATGSSPWTKNFTLPGSTVNTDANGIVISGNTFAPPLSENANTVVYSYVAWSEANTSGGGGGGIPGYASFKAGPPIRPGRISL